MFGNPAAERAAIEMTYEDTATVSRTTLQKINNISKHVPEDIYTDSICALVYSGSDKSQQMQAQNKIDYDAIIFFPPSLSILPGDKIALKRFGRDNPDSTIVYNFEVVGRPNIYATHQEVRVKDGDLA